MKRSAPDQEAQSPKLKAESQKNKGKKPRKLGSGPRGIGYGSNCSEIRENKGVSLLLFAMAENDGWKLIILFYSIC